MPVPSDNFGIRDVLTEGGLSADTYASLRSLLTEYPPGSGNDSLRDYSSFSFANPQTISLSAASFSPTYGDVSFTFTATARTAADATIPWTTGFSITSNDTGKITVANTGSPSSGVQTFTVTIVGATTSNVTLTIAIASGTVSSVLYNAAQTTATVSVAKKGLTITANAVTKTYGDTNPAKTSSDITTSAFAYSEGLANLGGTLAFTYSCTQYSNAGGAYTITPSGYTSNNYTITFATGVVTVNKAAATISFGSTSLTYNGAAQSPTYAITGVQSESITSGVTIVYRNNDTSTNDIEEPTNAASSAGATVTTFRKTITVDNTNYSGTSNTNFTIARAANTISSFSPTLSGTVAGTQTLSAAANGGATISFSVNDATLANVSGTTLTYKRSNSAGTLTVTATAAQAQNYTSQTSTSGNFTISKKSITTATLSGTSVTYNADQKTVTVSYTETIGGESISATFDAITYAGSATAPTNAASYALSVAIASANTSFTGTTTGTLTIAQKSVTLTAEAKSKSYEQNNSVISPTLSSSSGLVSGHSISAHGLYVDGTVVGTSSVVAAYANAIKCVTGNVVILDGSSNVVTSNYSISANNATVTVNKANISVAASGKAYTYGDTAGDYLYPNGNLTITNTSASVTAGGTIGTITKRYRTDTDGTIVSYAPTEKVTSSTTDTWSVLVAIAATDNYNAFTEAQFNSVLTITKASQTVSFSLPNVNVTVGGTQTLSATSNSGLISFTFSTSQSTYVYISGTTIYFKRSAGASTVSVTATIASNNNYTSAASSATYTSIAKKSITTATLSGTSVTYNDDVKTVTATYSEVLGDETISATFNAITYAGSATAPTNAASYALSVAIASANTSFTGTTTGTLTISTRSITITADNKSRVYRDTDPALTSTLTSGTLASNNAHYTIVTLSIDSGVVTVNSGINGGVAYANAITLSTVIRNGADDDKSSNYTITHVKGTLTITVANTQMQFHGALTAEYTGIYLIPDNRAIHSTTSEVIVTANGAIASSGDGTVEITRLSGGVYRDITGVGQMINVGSYSDLRGRFVSSTTNYNTSGYTPADSVFEITSAPPPPPPPPPPPCFGFGSLVSMADNTTKLIENIVVGDVLRTINILGMPDESNPTWYSFSTNSITGSAISTTTVLSARNGSSASYYLLNGNIKVTYEHKFFIKRENVWSWIIVQNLIVGDVYLNENIEEQPITSIELINEVLDCVTLNTESNDTYIACGIYNHNAKSYS